MSNTNAVCTSVEVCEAHRIWLVAADLYRALLAEKLLSKLRTVTCRPESEVRASALAEYERLHEVCGPVHSLQSAAEVRAEALKEAARAVRGSWYLSDMPRDFDTLEDAARTILALIGQGKP